MTFVSSEDQVFTFQCIGVDGAMHSVTSTLHPVPATACDVNGDSKIDSTDINLILAARNTSALPDDPRDADGDGIITVNDARICVNRCTNTLCAP